MPSTRSGRRRPARRPASPMRRARRWPSRSSRARRRRCSSPPTSTGWTTSRSKNLIKPETRSNLLGNRIVLIAPKDKAQADRHQAGLRPRQGARRRPPRHGQRRRRPGRQIRQGGAGEARRVGQRVAARSRKPRTCARRCCWSRAARRRPASSTRPMPRPTPTSRSSARSRRTRTRRSSIRSR